MSLPLLRRTPEAVADLDEIWDYFAADNPAAADRVLDELNETFDLLSKNPQTGELQPNLADGKYRRFSCRQSVIYYRPMKEGIVVVRVLHGARDHEQFL